MATKYTQSSDQLNPWKCKFAMQLNIDYLVRFNSTKGKHEQSKYWYKWGVLIYTAWFLQVQEKCACQIIQQNWQQPEQDSICHDSKNDKCLIKFSSNSCIQW